MDEKEAEALPIMGTIFLVYICVSVVCQITWNHVNQTRACSKSVLGGKIRPVTALVLYGRKRNVHLEMRNLKQTELHRLKNRGKKR